MFGACKFYTKTWINIVKYLPFLHVCLCIQRSECVLYGVVRTQTHKQSNIVILRGNGKEKEENESSVSAHTHTHTHYTQRAKRKL